MTVTERFISPYEDAAPAGAEGWEQLYPYYLTFRPERRLQPSLTTEQVRAIAVLAKRAEQHHGSPQDLEWAIEAGKVHLLQCRPETVWARKPAPTLAAHTGMAGIVDTLVNPLASRRSTHVRTPD